MIDPALKVQIEYFCKARGLVYTPEIEVSFMAGMKYVIYAMTETFADNDTNAVEFIIQLTKELNKYFAKEIAMHYAATNLHGTTRQ